MLSKNYVIDKELADALTKHMVLEMESSQLYLFISPYFCLRDLKGFSLFFEEQSKEEFEHFMKFFNLLKRLGVDVNFCGTQSINTDWQNIEQILTLSRMHEEKVSASIHNLYKLAKLKESFIVENFLRWFIEEQLEEENKFKMLHNKYRFNKNDSAGISSMDDCLMHVVSKIKNKQNTEV